MILTQILQKIKTVVYTKSQIDSMGGGTSLDTTIKSKANTGHNHDDRYYTESEINTKLNSKANTSDLLPIGSYIQFAGSQAPTGFLVCNGGAISRTAYSKLFAVIGTKYGKGDGSTTFNLPNLIDRFLQGSTTSGTVKNAGLPNINGFADVRYPTMTNPAGGALSWGYTDQQYSSLAQSDPALSQRINFTASWSNSIYGNSSTVQPPALTCLICIKY